MPKSPLVNLNCAEFANFNGTGLTRAGLWGYNFRDGIKLLSNFGQKELFYPTEFLELFLSELGRLPQESPLM